MSEIILEIDNVSGYNIDGFKIEDINMKVMEGEVNVLVGENNSEQNTFVNILAGIKTHKTSGRLIYKGKQIKDSFKGINEVCFLFPENTLIDEFTVAENLALNKYPKRRGIGLIHWKQIKVQAEEILQQLNINILKNKKVAKLTDEEKKLVEIAKIFISNPKLVILYEPIEKLSINNVHNLYEIIKKYKKNGVSIIYVTRNWIEALKIGDSISVLSKGKIKGCFTSKEAKNNPQKLLNLLSSHNYRINELETDNESKEILDSVFKAAEFITSEYELKDVLMFLAKSVTKAMNAHGCRIDLIDSNTKSVIDTFEFQINSDLHANLKKDFIINFIEKEMLYYSNENDKEFNSLFEDKENIKTIICVPLLVRSRVSGIIQILYKDLYIYSTDEAKYLNAFAKQAAIAIEDTRLMGRSALLQESHHRIKNNLQAISSFVILQKKYLNTEHKQSLDYILDNIVSRIKSIAAVHDLLSKDHLGRSIINIKDLIQQIIQFMKLDEKIKFELEIEDMFIPYSKATSISLIINELISNCIKYAFLNYVNMYPRINIKGFREDNQVIIIIHDNGKGYPKDFFINNSNGLGLNIVSSIIKNEFGGKIEYSNDQGAKAIIHLLSSKVFVGM